MCFPKGQGNLEFSVNQDDVKQESKLVKIGD